MAKKSARSAPAAAHTAGDVLVPRWWHGVKTQSGPVYWLLLLAAIWMLLAVVYPGPVLHGQAFLSSDASNSYGFGMVGDRSVHAGHYPLWNPYLFAGMPSFGSLAYPKFVYPPAIVFEFLQTRLGFPPLTWLFGHLLFGGLGMMWLLSRWRLPTACLLLGAVVFLFFPKVVAWGVHGHGSKLAAAMYLPWLVGWALRVQDRRTWGRQLQAVGVLGLLMGLQFLRGHVQITYYSLATVGWLALWNAVAPFAAHCREFLPAARARGLGLVLVGLAVGALIGAVLLVPVHDYAGLSIRGQDVAGGGGVGLDYATGWSLAPAELGTLVLPAAVGYGKATYMGLMPFNDYPNYFGFLLLVLAAAAWERRNRSFWLAVLVLSLLATVASFGQGFYAFLYHYLPFFNKFRVPSMILIVPAFALALLAPRGLSALARARYPGGNSWVLPVVLGLIGLVCVAGGGLGLAKSSFLAQLTALAAQGGKQAASVLLDQAWQLHKTSLVRIGWLCWVAAGVCWLARGKVGFREQGLLWVLVALVFADLVAVDQGVIYPEKTLHEVARDGRGGGRLVPAGRLVQDFVPVAEIGPGPAAASVAAVAGHDRVWPLGALGGQNQWMADGIRSLGGYHPAKLAAYEQIRKRLYSGRPAGRLAAWLAGRAVVFQGVFREDDLVALRGMGLDLVPASAGAGTGVPSVYLNRAALPRARLLTHWEPVSSLPGKGALEPFLEGVAAGSIDVRETVYLAEEPSLAPGAATRGSGGLPTPAFVTDGLDEVVLTVDSPVPAVLVLADMMAPGWQVEVDGEAQPLLAADLVLRAVDVAAGPHTVRFHYGDPSVRKGLTLTVIGMILALLLMVMPGATMISTRRRRRVAAPTSEE